MTSPLTKLVSILLLDIEGTTTPINFVYSVLFPYARANVKNYLAAHGSLPLVQTDIAALVEENADDLLRGLDPPLLGGPASRPSLDTVEAYVLWLMDRDRKTTPLKSLQGKIWDEGYRRGELHSQVFDDVPRAFKRWHEQKKPICIYSSGSVLAQELLFAHTQAGDLTLFIKGYYDTNIGAKKEPDSYRRIAGKLGLEATRILFISDVTDELDAAAGAGFQTILCVRPGNHPQGANAVHPIIKTFDEILP